MQCFIKASASEYGTPKNSFTPKITVSLCQNAGKRLSDKVSA